MTRRLAGRTAVASILFAAAAILAAGTGLAQPDRAKGGKEPLPAPKPVDPNPAADALQDELDLLLAQTKQKQAAIAGANGRLKAEEDVLKRLEAASDAVAQSELARQRAAVETAKADASTKAADLRTHEATVKLVERKLGVARANPPKPAGPSATDTALAKLVQLAAERNAAEKEWMAKEAARLTDEARRQKQLLDEERARRAKEDQDREVELKDARARAADAERQLKEETKRRLDAEAERARQEKLAVLKRLPGEIADADLRVRAAELKQQQLKLELDAAAREIDRQKANRVQLEELKAALEKELKPKIDR